MEYPQRRFAQDIIADYQIRDQVQRESCITFYRHKMQYYHENGGDNDPV